MGIYIFSVDSSNLSTMYIGSSRSLTTRPLYHNTSSLKPNISGDFYIFIKWYSKYSISSSTLSSKLYRGRCNENGTMPNQHNNSILMAFSSFYIGILVQALLSFLIIIQVLINRK